jgi:hypothetical protein
MSCGLELRCTVVTCMWKEERQSEGRKKEGKKEIVAQKKKGR